MSRTAPRPRTMVDANAVHRVDRRRWPRPVEMVKMWPFARRSTQDTDELLDDDPQRLSIEMTMQYGYALHDREHVRSEALKALERGSQSKLAPTFERPAG